MSKKAKSESKKRRLKEKQQRKAAKTAEYEGYRKAGKNEKSKRFKLKAKGARFRPQRHVQGDCGNVGCIRCQGINFALFVTAMPQKYWLRMQAQKAGRPYP